LFVGSKRARGEECMKCPRRGVLLNEITKAAVLLDNTYEIFG
jgi:hypothetical protein